MRSRIPESFISFFFRIVVVFRRLFWVPMGLVDRFDSRPTLTSSKATIAVVLKDVYSAFADVHDEQVKR